jgi:hypothetical protein
VATAALLHLGAPCLYHPFGDFEQPPLSGRRRKGVLTAAPSTTAEQAVAMPRACRGRHAAACRSPAEKAAPPGRRAPKGGSHSQPAGLRLPTLGAPVRGFWQVPVASPSYEAPATTACSCRPPSAHAQLRTHGGPASRRVTGLL